MSSNDDALTEKAARALCELEPGEDWPTNEALGGNLTGTRDDEYRHAMREQAQWVLDAIGDDLRAEGWERGHDAGVADGQLPDGSLCHENPYRREHA